MISRLHKLAVLAAVLAAGALAPAALAEQPATPGSGPVPLSQDLRSPDARDAALHPHYLQRRAVPQPPATAARHTAGSGGGLGTAPLAGILAAAGLAAAALTAAARRRQARPVA